MLPNVYWGQSYPQLRTTGLGFSLGIKIFTNSPRDSIVQSRLSTADLDGAIYLNLNMYMNHLGNLLKMQILIH